MNKREKGNKYEAQTVEYISNLGYNVVCRNYRRPTGEIDIIAKDGSTTVFIEVKFRASNIYGTPAEAININKRNKIIRTAKWYAMEYSDGNMNFRFDVALWNNYKLKYYKNAFMIN